MCFPGLGSPRPDRLNPCSSSRVILRGQPGSLLARAPTTPPHGDVDSPTIPPHEDFRSNSKPTPLFIFVRTFASISCSHSYAEYLKAEGTPPWLSSFSFCPHFSSFCCTMSSALPCPLFGTYLDHFGQDSLGSGCSPRFGMVVCIC